jgi:hypothetical protein
MMREWVRSSLAAIAMLPLLAAGVSAQDAGAWRTESSEQFRQGFVAGIASYLHDYGGPGGRGGYADCLAGETDRSLLEVVEIWMDHHAEAASLAPGVAVTMALNDYCNGFAPDQPKMP